jgi:hypothetical protein
LPFGGIVIFIDVFDFLYHYLLTWRWNPGLFIWHQNNFFIFSTSPPIVLILLPCVSWTLSTDKHTSLIIFYNTYFWFQYSMTNWQKHISMSICWFKKEDWFRQNV